MSEAATIERKLPPTERIAVKAKDAAALMSCSKSTFFSRVKAGVYPKAGPDGAWGVRALLHIAAYERAHPKPSAAEQRKELRPKAPRLAGPGGIFAWRWQRLYAVSIKYV